MSEVLLGEGVSIHPTAVLEKGVKIGDHTSIWNNVHIRYNSVIGKNCIVGEKTYIAYQVCIGNMVKINSHVYICTGVAIENGVMISAGVIFTNDRFPRAATADLRKLRLSKPDENTLQTIVRQGATIGAGSIVGCDLEIGRFAMVGMGSIITKNVPPFYLVFGQPAKPQGIVCRCGQVLLKFTEDTIGEVPMIICEFCELKYRFSHHKVIEINPPVDVGVRMMDEYEKQ